MKNVAAVIAGLGLVSILLLQELGGGAFVPRPALARVQDSVLTGGQLAVTGMEFLARHRSWSQSALGKQLVAMVKAQNPLLFRGPSLGIYTQVYQYRGTVQQPSAPPPQSFLHSLRHQATAVIHQGKSELLGQNKQSLWSQGQQELLDLGRSHLHQSLDGNISKPNLDMSSVQKYDMNVALDAQAKTAQTEIQDRGPKLDSSGEVSAKMADYTSQVDQHSKLLDQFTQPTGLLQNSGSGGDLGQLGDKLLQHTDSSSSAPLSRLLHGLTDKPATATKPTAEQHPKKAASHGFLARVSSSVESVEGAAQHSSDRVTHGAGDLVKESLNHVVKGNPVAERTAVALGAISATSQGIAAIVATVNDIVVQANLLAVNMVVDTAGATLKGKGYGDVGKEFTGLFKRTASVATHISDLLQSGMGSVQCLILPGGEAERQRALEQAVGQLSGVVQKMTAVATGQVLGLPQLNAAMQLVSKIARLNQDLLAQVTGLGQGLWNQSKRLFSLITSFRQQEPEGFVPLRRAVATRSDFLQPPVDFADPLPYPFWR